MLGSCCFFFFQDVFLDPFLFKEAARGAGESLQLGAVERPAQRSDLSSEMKILCVSDSPLVAVAGILRCSHLVPPLVRQLLTCFRRVHCPAVGAEINAVPFLCVLKCAPLSPTRGPTFAPPLCSLRDRKTRASRVGDSCQFAFSDT